MNAGTSRIYISTSHVGQGFSDVYRKACERIAMDPNSPKYVALDILMWLTLTDPRILALKPGTLTAQILSGDEDQVKNCWKCLAIMGMSALLYGYPKDGLEVMQAAVNVVKRDTGSVPAWLTSRVDLAAHAAQGKARIFRLENVGSYLLQTVRKLR
jgi:hypothetical protein